MGEDLDVDVAEPSGQVLVQAGGRCPRDELGRPRTLLRAGDVLRVSCPMREAEVGLATEHDVCVRWPWPWLHDSQSYWDEAAGFDLDSKGLMGFDRDPRHPDAGWLFQFDPGLPVLQTGDRCQVGIPPTIVHVFDVTSWYAPFHVTWDQSESLMVGVLPQGVPHDLGRLDDADTLRPYEREPIRVELLFRPYPELRDLDMVADRHGREWVFCGPWWWVELGRDGGREGLPVPLVGPAWPLTLLAQIGGRRTAPRADCAGDQVDRAGRPCQPSGRVVEAGRHRAVGAGASGHAATGRVRTGGRPRPGTRQHPRRDPRSDLHADPGCAAAPLGPLPLGWHQRRRTGGHQDATMPAVAGRRDGERAPGAADRWPLGVRPLIAGSSTRSDPPRPNPRSSVDHVGGIRQLRR
jgi:hypothetical protein